jgi:hypothetical protein
VSSIFIGNKPIIIKNMAKAKVSAGTSNRKVTFGKRGKGKAKKSYSKYEEKPKKYRGQGR